LDLIEESQVVVDSPGPPEKHLRLDDDAMSAGITVRDLMPGAAALKVDGATGRKLCGLEAGQDPRPGYLMPPRTISGYG